MATHFTLSGLATSRQEIKKSRFIAAAGPVADEAAAKAFIAAHSDPTANHNCWAWRCGQNYRFNDDGEPSGTAGKPILAALDGQALDGVAVVVTRWFGGVLLGSGGLIRAYGGTAALCLLFGWKVGLIAAFVHVNYYLGGSAAVNAIGHRFGRRPYDNNAGNLQWLAFATAGATPTSPSSPTPFALIGDIVGSTSSTKIASRCGMSAWTGTS